MLSELLWPWLTCVSECHQSHHAMQLADSPVWHLLWGPLWISLRAWHFWRRTRLAWYVRSSLIVLFMLSWWNYRSFPPQKLSCWYLEICFLIRKPACALPWYRMMLLSWISTDCQLSNGIRIAENVLFARAEPDSFGVSSHPSMCPVCFHDLIKILQVFKSRNTSIEYGKWSRKPPGNIACQESRLVFVGPKTGQWGICPKPWIFGPLCYLSSNLLSKGTKFLERDLDLRILESVWWRVTGEIALGVCLSQSIKRKHHEPSLTRNISIQTIAKTLHAIM